MLATRVPSQDGQGEMQRVTVMLERIVRYQRLLIDLRTGAPNCSSTPMREPDDVLLIYCFNNILFGLLRARATASRRRRHRRRLTDSHDKYG